SSIACSGTGGVALRKLQAARAPAMPATRKSAPVTISREAHHGIVSASAAAMVASANASPKNASTSAPALSPTPTPSDAAFCLSSSCASSISRRVSALACSATSCAAAPTDWLPFRAGTSRTLDGLAVQLPDRTLRLDRTRVGERAQDPHGAADPFLVAARKAARNHLRRRPVAEAPGGPELQREAGAVAPWVQRRHVERGAVEPVGRLELDLGEEVAPVAGDRRQRQLPARAQRRRRRRRCRHDDRIRLEELEPRGDALVVDPLEQPL